MSYERLIKRTIYTAKCPCGGINDSVADNPPKERLCPVCRTWIPFKEESWTGKDLKEGNEN